MNNKDMDATVLTIIEQHAPIRFGEICHFLDVPTSDGKRYRPVDRAIQRLRKAGKIDFVKGKWVKVVEKVAIPSETTKGNGTPEVPAAHQW